jgi:hypothetical protein
MPLERRSATWNGRGDPQGEKRRGGWLKGEPCSHPGQQTTDRPAATGAIFLKSSRNPSFEPTNGRKEIYA